MLAVKTLVPEQTIFRRNARFIGANFEIGIVSDNAYIAEECIAAAFAEISRVEKLLSVFYDDSAINKINRNAGGSPVEAAPEVFRLLSRLIEISRLTAGAFDITYNVPQPAAKELEDTTIAKLKKASYKQIELNPAKQTVFLKNKNIRITFGAIIKGYAADRAKYILQMNGIGNGFINADDKILTWGSQPGNLPWTAKSVGAARKCSAFPELNISNMALATALNNVNDSSNTGKPLLNTICPEKGFQVSNTKSVLVLSTTAEMAAAMVAPLNAIGINAGLYLINQLNQVACIFIDDQERIYASKGLAV